MLSRDSEKTAPCAAITRSGICTWGRYFDQKLAKVHLACCCARSGSRTELANLLGRKGDQPVAPSALHTLKCVPVSVLLSISAMRTLNCVRS